MKLTIKDLQASTQLVDSQEDDEEVATASPRPNKKKSKATGRNLLTSRKRTVILKGWMRCTPKKKKSGLTPENSSKGEDSDSDMKFSMKLLPRNCGAALSW